MKRQLIFLFSLTLVVLVAGQKVAETPSLQSWPPLSLDAQRATVSQDCAACHNDTVKSGGFSWTTVDLAHPEQSAERIEKVVRKLQAGLMPPPGRPRPDSATVKSFV